MSEAPPAWPPNNLLDFLNQSELPMILDRICQRVSLRLKSRNYDTDRIIDHCHQVLVELLDNYHSKHTGSAITTHPLVDLSSFDSIDTWIAYFEMIVRNRIIDEFRKTAREKTYNSGMSILDYVSSIPDEPFLMESPELPSGFLERLDLKQRAVYVLMREGFTQTEISGLMHLSSARVSQIKSTALRRLKAFAARLRRGS